MAPNTRKADKRKALELPMVAGLAHITVSPDASALITPFRRRALHLLLELTAETSGQQLNEAHVGTWIPMSDEDPEPRLELHITEDALLPEVIAHRTRVFERVAEHARNWDDTEREDYRTRIVFTLEPSDW